MSSFVFDFRDIDNTKLNLVGGKGANLGELSGIEGLHVPEGFCVSTAAFKIIIEQYLSIQQLLDRLSILQIADRDKIRELSAEIRPIIEGIAIPQNIADEIVSKINENTPYAVRSSATIEDLDLASAAGQHDTYLNIIGKNAILKHVRKCWASLFSERAITYRIQNGFDHREVSLSVVIQQMIFPYAAGVMFTADPVTSNRKVVSIDAGFGLGEAFVSGIVNADCYKVKGNKVVDKRVARKALAIYGQIGGGTEIQQIHSDRQETQTLTEQQVLALAGIGRKIESHFGRPQDIEWCLAENIFYIVQSRPITTLYPVPAATAASLSRPTEIDDQENHVYVSVGHQQMMTDAMKPLGLSVWQLTAARPMYKAGGRLFVDVTHEMSSPITRHILLNVLGKSDLLVRDALLTVASRQDFIKMLPDEVKEQGAVKGNNGYQAANYQALINYDPSIVADLIRKSETSLEELRHDIQTKTGSELIDFILQDFDKLKKGTSDPQSFGVIMTGMNASSWLNDKMMEWLGEQNVADTLSQSVPNNVTSEMGLGLLDVADAIRPHHEVVEYLHEVKHDNFLSDLVSLKGGREARDAIEHYLNKYGMRCAGEIDITKPRWSEKPSALIPLILSNIKNFERGASRKKFEQGKKEALQKEQELLDRLKQMPDGEQKAEETKRMIDLVRNLVGYREYPKYSIVSRYFIYKKALLKEAERLANAKVFHAKEDVFYLTLHEFHEVIRTRSLDYQVISRRKEEHKIFERLTPPRVITSDGEIIAGEYKHENLPAGAIAGLPVSLGVAEGRARVILNMEEADLGKDDILVTTFTDPSWTPLFVSIKGLVTEVGGRMSHGAVIAREYGLPAVVAVENATRLIKDGQWIRVNGTAGYIEML